jgi:hypothetical protein
MRRRLLLWVLLPAALLAVGFLVTAAILLRPASLRRLAEEGLTKHLNLETTIDGLTVSFLPRPHLSGTGLTMRVPGQPELPPFVAIERFELDIGPIAVIRRHFGTLHVDGLRITVPPGDMRDDLPSPGGDATADSSRDRRVVLEHLIAHDAELTFIKKSPDKTPLKFLIHDLAVDAISFDSAIPFSARLTNPVPTGLVDTTGTFGPWRRDDPTDTPLSGTYTFSNADLSTINGIGGILTSEGSYEGELTRIVAKGTTETPDFSLDLGGKPVPLTTTFEAIVDGTNGSTQLVRVDAKMRDTAIQTSGLIANLSGPGHHDINLRVQIADGRIEDILALAIDSPTPMLVGDLSLDTSFHLPPGESRVPHRLALAGRFGLTSARFSDAQVQKKLQELSRRSQGKDKDEEIGRVLTNLRGRFESRDGTLRLSGLTFQVPGANVALNGVYGLESGAIDFRGQLRMQATMSQAVGGFKSIFLKPFDFILRKDGAGAVLPIKITGTRDKPKMSVEVGKIFGR